jgi:hypothetical protein
MSSNRSQPVAGVGWKRPHAATSHGRYATHAHAATSAQSTLGQQDPPTHTDHGETRRTHARDREHKDQSQPPPPFSRPTNPPTLHGAHTRTGPHQHARPGCVARLRPSLAHAYEQGTHERTHARSHPRSHPRVFGSRPCHVTDCASVRSSSTRVPAASSSPRQRPPHPLEGDPRARAVRDSGPLQPSCCPGVCVRLGRRLWVRRRRLAGSSPAAVSGSSVFTIRIHPAG